MRCWRRSSSGVGVDLNFSSTAASWGAEVRVKPRIWARAALEIKRSAIGTRRERVMGGCDCTSGDEGAMRGEWVGWRPITNPISVCSRHVEVESRARLLQGRQVFDNEIKLLAELVGAEERQKLRLQRAEHLLGLIFA